MGETWNSGRNPSLDEKSEKREIMDDSRTILGRETGHVSESQSGLIISDFLSHARAQAWLRCLPLAGWLLIVWRPGRDSNPQHARYLVECRTGDSRAYFRPAPASRGPGYTTSTHSWYSRNRARARHTCPGQGYPEKPASLNLPNNARGRSRNLPLGIERGLNMNNSNRKSPR
jgi:hypothetical protein